MTLGEQTLQALANHLSQVEGVRAGIVVNRDGRPVANVVTGEDEDLLGALTGAIFATVNRAMQRTGLGELDDVVISATGGAIQAMAAGDLVLVVLADHQCNVGLIRLELRRAAATIRAGANTADAC